MYNNFIIFSQQQASLSGQRSEKPTFYRDFILDSQLNGPRSISTLPSLTRIGPDITFTRTSSATFINQQGNIQLVDQNVPRFEWGNHRTNLLSASNDINSSAWGGYWAKSPDWKQNAVGPDNVQNSAWSLPLSSCIYGPLFKITGLIQYFTDIQTRPLSGATLTVSVWAKADDTSYQSVVFGISDQDYTFIAPTTTWRRFSYTGSFLRDNIFNNRGLQVFATSGVNTNNNSKIYFYGFQCEAGSTVTPYISTGTTPVTVSEPKGLLIEESRTNFAGQQNLFNWSRSSLCYLSAGTGIAGLSSYIVGDANNSTTLGFANVGYTFPTFLLSATTYCFSCFIKKNPNFNNTHPLLRINYSPSTTPPLPFAGICFNQATGQAFSNYLTTTSAVSVEDFKTFYRASFTFNSQSSARPASISIFPSHGYLGAGSATLTGTEIEVAGIQVEQGTFPTSYIPTFGSGYTRNADNATISGNQFASLYNNKEGTLFAEGDTKNLVSTPWLVAINDNNYSNAIGIYARVGLAPNFVGAQYERNDVTYNVRTSNFNPESLSLRNESIVRVGTNYNTTSATLFANGVVYETNSIEIPSRVINLQLGRYIVIGYLNGHIRKVGYWPKRLSNTTLQALTLSSLGFAKYFAQDKSLYTGTGPGVEVYRNSSATYFDENGILRTVGANRPRFDHDPATGVSKGLLIEEPRTNFILNSQDFSSNTWSKVNGVTVASNVIKAPDGTMTGDKLIVPVNGYSAGTTTYNTKGDPYTFSIFMKAGERHQGYMAFGGAGNNQAVEFNLLNGTIVGIGYGGNDPINTFKASITPVGDGWYRCTLTGALPLTAISGIYPIISCTMPAVGTEGLYVWGAQFEAGTFVTSYIPTTNAAVTRAEDIIQVNSSSFDTFYNPEQGTFYAKVLPLSGAQTAAIIDVGDTYNSIHGIWKSGEGGDGSVGTQWNTFSDSYFLSAGAQYTPLTSNFTSLPNTANLANRVAYTYGPTFATAVSTSLITQTTAVSALPSLEGFSYFNGHIQSLEYYNTMLTTTQLTALSN